jgi:hypothetical protein
MALKIQKIENTGVVYADPADPGLSVRFKQTEQAKSLGGLPTTNHVTEVIINDDNQISLSGNSVTDAVSIRVRVSATSQSKARVKQLLGVLASSSAWVDEDVFGGFRPATIPTVPTV